MNVVLFSTCLMLIYSASAKDCTSEEALVAVKRPAFDFSSKLLAKISKRTNHFVYSPISTWLQVAALADGAMKHTQRKILLASRLTGSRSDKCFRSKLGELVIHTERKSTLEISRYNMVLIDRNNRAKDSFKQDVEKLEVNVIETNSEAPEETALRINEIIESRTDHNVQGNLNPSDFNGSSIFLYTVAYFKTTWKQPFDTFFTEAMPFYSDEGNVIGTQHMMFQVGNFSLSAIKSLKSLVIDIPTSKDNVSMLVFLPTEDKIRNVFNRLEDTSLNDIFVSLEREGPKLVNVSLPKFDLDSEVEVNDILKDMGMKRAFDAKDAEFEDISGNRISVSDVKQKVKVVFDENCNDDSVISEFGSLEFNANKPFAFILVDKMTHFIYFAGMFSEPVDKRTYSSFNDNDNWSN